MTIPLYPYQQRAVEFLDERQGCAGLFAEMGTGKTRMALAFLVQKHARRIFVICPLSVVGVWRGELRKLGLTYNVVNISTGTLASRAYKLKIAAQSAKLTIVFCNYESYWREPLRRVIRRYQTDAVIFDEAHRLKSRTTKQSRFAHDFSDRQDVRYRLALTGTPVTNGLQDLFSIYRFIDPTVFGDRWIDFEDRYLVVRMHPHLGYPELKGYKNVEEANAKVAATAYQISKSEALDLPERVDVVVPVELSPATRAKYEEFKKQAIAEIEGTDDEGRPKHGLALARIVLTGLLRLQQITGGFINTESGLIDVSDEKLRTAVDLAEDAIAGGERVVIFCRFIHDLKRLYKHFPDAAIIAGSVKPEAREQAIADLRTGRTSVLLAQTAAGSLGIDLSAASVGIFYSTGFSLSEFLQARDRLHRHGQTRKVTYYHLACENTVDEKVVQALQDKQDIARLVARLDYAKKIFTSPLENA